MPVVRSDSVILPQCCKVDGNSALWEISKEPSSSTISTEASFDDDSNEKTVNVNKVCRQ